jgi:hypothetical protein
MSPNPILAPPRALALRPQRPWRRVEAGSRRPSRPVAHAYAAAVVRELPPRAVAREPAGTW